MAKLIKIAESKDLPPGEGGVFNVAGEQVVVFNVDGNYYAIEDRFNRDGAKSPTLDGGTKYYNVTKSGDDIQLEV